MSNHTAGPELPSVATDGYPPVLDACCGCRMMWFDKEDKRATFMDIRREQHEIPPNNGWPNGTTFVIDPDVQASFTEMPFPDETFQLVVFDPPHIQNMGQGKRADGIIAKRYGLLFSDWRPMLEAGFAECFRVLKPGGVLVFKWCEVEIPLSEVLALTKEPPLFGHRGGAKMGTHWVCFLKPCSVSVPVSVSVITRPDSFTQAVSNRDSRATPGP